MKKILLLAISVIVMLPLVAQSEMEQLLNEIENNNTTLQALQKQIESQKLNNKTGIYLSNPEVEFGYLWGSPAEIGNESSLSVTQSVDFPTSYSHRRKISDMENQNLEVLYKSERVEVLLNAKELAINLSYYNALVKDYANRVKIIEEVAESYQKMYEEGNIDILERNQVYMDLLSYVNERDKFEIERNSLLNELKALNGGNEIQFNESEVPFSPIPSDFNEWYAEAEKRSPVLQYLNQQIEISKQQVKLNKALSLPKLSVGYADEKILGQKLQGVTIGVTIPLWENKNSVKKAKADIFWSESVLEDNKLQYYNRLQNLFNKSVDLQKTIVTFRLALTTYNSMPLLRKALESGEISLHNYLLQLDGYNDKYNSMLEAERDYAIAVAELTAVTL